MVRAAPGSMGERRRIRAGSVLHLLLREKFSNHVLNVPETRHYAMVLHFERILTGHTSTDIYLIYHPSVPDTLARVAISTQRNIDGP